MAGDKKESVLGKIFVAVAVALLAGGSSPWWWDKFFPKPTVTPTPNPSSSVTLSPSPVSSKGEDVWSCRAANKTAAYIVDQLDRNRDNFDVAIIDNVDKNDEGHYFGTVPIQITQKSDEVVGSGRLGSRSINVNALGRTVAFSIQDSVAGEASGRCSINNEVASNEKRELVRYCLSIIKEKQAGELAQVQRFGCEGDPQNYIKEFQSQGSK